MKNQKYFFLVAAMIFSVPALSQADVTVEKEFKGSILVTSPEGNVQMAEEGDEVPAIVPNSSLEVFDGEMDVQQQAGDKVTLACLSHKMLIQDAASAHLVCGETAGKVKAVAGNLTILKPNGDTELLLEGKEYDILLPALKVAPPTAAGDDLGRPIVDDAPPVDPRSIDSSPS